MKLWTWKFAAGLAVLVVFVLLALPLAKDPTTGEPGPLWDFTETGPASFVFLIALLYVLAHAGGWVSRRLRGEKAPEPEEKKKRRKGGNR